MAPYPFPSASILFGVGRHRGSAWVGLQKCRQSISVVQGTKASAPKRPKDRQGWRLYYPLMAGQASERLWAALWWGALAESDSDCLRLLKPGE